MPFTFSHPSIILPFTFLRKRWYSLTGLVIGSMVPDFEYFLRMKVESYYSHKFSGILWFDLPLGVLLAFMYHNIVRDSLLYNLPKVAKSRVIQFTNFNWNRYFIKNWPVVLISVLIGVVSHVIWDGFTHDRGYFVHRIPALLNEVVIAGERFQVCRMLQHTSTLLGAIAIAYALLKLPKTKLEDCGIHPLYFINVGTVALVAITIKLIAVKGIVTTPDLAAAIISAVLLGLIIAPFLAQYPHYLPTAIKKS